LEFALRGRSGECPRKLGGKFPLLANRSQDDLSSGFELREVLRAFHDLANLHFIEPPGCLLSITRQERHCRPLSAQLQHCRNATLAQLKLLGDGSRPAFDLAVVSLSFAELLEACRSGCDSWVLCVRDGLHRKVEQSNVSTSVLPSDPT